MAQFPHRQCNAHPSPIVTVSKSPNRGTFQRDAYIARCEADGKIPDPAMLELYGKWQEGSAEREASDEWKKNNLEYDLRSSPLVLDKVRTSDTYAQNLYAAICNNEFQQLDVFPILANETWSCSWRYAGGIIADMRQEGDYIDWYCSGIGDGLGNGDEDGTKGYVSESVVTEEIEKDLLALGWQVLVSEENP